MNKKFILCLALFMGFSLMGPSMSHGQILIKSENVEKNNPKEEVFDMAYGTEEVLMGNEVKKDMIAKLPEEVDMTKEEKEMYVGVYSIYNPVNGQDISMEVFWKKTYVF